MGEALLWGAVAASSLVVGAVLGLVWRWPAQLVGAVLAFGAGALISAVSFDLAEEGARAGGYTLMAIGLGVGGLTYLIADWLVQRAAGGGGEDPGPALALGAFLDGIPEQMVLGIGIAAGNGVSASLLIAVFVSNLPEAIGSVAGMRQEGRRSPAILGLWVAVAVVCTVASVAGFLLADVTASSMTAAINGFAAGALLVMLVDSMIPDAAKDTGRWAGIITVLGFALGAGLTSVG